MKTMAALASTILICVMVIILSRFAHCQEMPSAPNSQVPEWGVPPAAVTYPKYPRALFVLEASALGVAIVENGRATVQERYNTNGTELHHQSGVRYAAINASIGLAASLVAWKLERSPRRPLRILGHAIMWGGIGYYSASYFRK